MPDMTIQVPSIILPTVWATGLEVENVADVAEHTSIDIPTEYLDNVTIHILAMELVAFGAPGALWCWVELSPVPTATSPLYWAAIGGGGGALPPVAPYIEAATGVNLTAHTFTLNFNVHSPYARLVVQTPVSAAPLAFWTVQALVDAKRA